MGKHLRKLLNSKITVTEGGKKRTMRYSEALMSQMGAKALTGSMADKVKFIEYVNRVLPEVMQPAPFEYNTTIRFVQAINGREAEQKDGVWYYVDTGEVADDSPTAPT